MKKTIAYCKSGKSRAFCGGCCSACYSQDVLTIDVCDKCGFELVYEDELNHEGETALCRNCMKKENNVEEESVWTQVKA